MFSLGHVEKLRSGAVGALDLGIVQIEANERNFLVVSSEYVLMGRKGVGPCRLRTGNGLHQHNHKHKDWTKII